MKIECPNCNAAFEVEAKYVGGHTTCSACGNDFEIKNPNLTECPDCFASISRRALFCPHCGDPYNPCPNCGTDNDQNAKRCVSCGAYLQTGAGVCPNCNAPLAPGSSFCGHCGYQVVTSGDVCSRCGAPLPPSVKFCSAMPPASSRTRRARVASGFMGISPLGWGLWPIIIPPGPKLNRPARRSQFFYDWGPGPSPCQRVGKLVR